MMRNILCIVSIFCSLFSFAQEETDEERPYAKRNPGIMRYYTGLRAPTPTTPDKFDRFNTDFFYNSWLGDLNNVETRFYAIGHNINMMFDIPFSKKSRMGIAIGFGYSHFNVRHQGAFSFIEDPVNTDLMFTSFAPYTGVKRWINRTVFNFVEIPFEIRFRTRSERNKWKFYPGFKVGFMVENYSKWRIDNLEFKAFNFPDLNRLHYGPSLRLGRNNIFLFGYYDMTLLFTNQHSNKLQLFSAGISIGWF